MHQSEPLGLSQAEVSRYTRHFNLKEVGVVGQKKLKQSSVLLIGAGGLGSPLALYLTASGIGRIGIIDFDIVDQSNLHRQILHGDSTVGMKKTISAQKRLVDINPFVDIEIHNLRLTADNVLDIFKRYDVIADGSDNFPTRYLVNDAAVLSGKPLVYGAISRFSGQLSVFNYKQGPCYRCLFPDAPAPNSVQSCSESGVLGVLPGVIGTMQAIEVIKILLNIGAVASGHILFYDALTVSFNKLLLEPNIDCKVCGEQPSIDQPIDLDYSCQLTNDKEQAVDLITASQLKKMQYEVVLVDVRESFEREICTIDSSIHIPLKELEDKYTTLNKASSIVIHCKSGARGLQAATLLMSLGFQNIKNLDGGILAWIEDIEPQQLRY